MGYIQYNKAELINLKHSLSKELIRTNRAGSFASTTVINCNTRKYHGLLICPIEKFGGDNFVLLSSLDETIIQHNTEFHLGIHKFPGEYSPKGHKYIREYEAEPIPSLIYRVGGVVIKKEMLLAEEEERILIRYTLLEANSPTKIKFQPFLAFRNVHELTHANLEANTRYQKAKNGIKVKMYPDFPYLYLQISKKAEYTHVPNWYYNIEYSEEEKRGYEFSEDLFVPGFFELPIKKGESVIFSAGTKEATTTTLNRQFEKEITKRVPRDSFENCLENSAQQFISKKKNKTKIIAGFPWFGHWARDTFISLPGLTLTLGFHDTFFEVIDTMISEIKNCFFHSDGHMLKSGGDSADAPLWFFWTLQQYQKENPEFDIWGKYGKKLRSILRCYKNGTNFNIKMHDNHLVWTGTEGNAVTWMDEFADGKPITPRIGYTVEINALWYNAICFALELANKQNDKKFYQEWKDIPSKFKENFISTFWNEKYGYLADYVDKNHTDWSVRPNMLFAASLPYSVLEKDMKKSVLDTIIKELLTEKGLRTLSPKDPSYKGIFEGNETERAIAYHQGTIRPWLLGHFCEIYLQLHKNSGYNFVKNIYDQFENAMLEYGIGTIAECYDGNPPHKPNGATSFALSVAELLRIKQLLKKHIETEG